MYEVKGKPWVYPGVSNVDECTTAEEVMRKAKLNWTVAKCELAAKIPVEYSHEYVDCSNAYGIYRTDNNYPLGIVKGRYTPVQNTDAFRFFDNAIGKDKALWQTAGCFDGGKRIFVSAKLPNFITINGDPIENYLVFINSHDGSSGIKILFTPIRIICENVMTLAWRMKTNYISFRHTNSVYDKIDIAKEILGICDERAKEAQEVYTFMAHKKITDNEAQNIFANIIFTTNELQNIKDTGHTVQQIIYRDYNAIQDSGVSMKKVNTISEMNNYYYGGIGQKQHIGTGFGVYNAINGFYSNVDNNEKAKRMDTLLFGDRAKKIETAADIIINF